MTSRRQLRSSASRRLKVPPVRLSTVGKLAFPVAGANMWNDLPFHITSAQSPAVFRQHLKTFLFSRSHQDILMWLTYYLLLSLFSFFTGISCRPWNNWQYLGHVKHVDDDDDDDDDEEDYGKRIQGSLGNFDNRPLTGQ